MLRLLADASLPLLTLFQSPFLVSTYQDIDTLKAQLSSHDILLCRSTLKVNASLLAESTIQVVATASSGVDHIDASYLDDHHISLFDTKGCNAHAVADYLNCTLSWLLKHQEIQNKTAGVIGLGHVGQKVASRLKDFGFNTYQYDPVRAEIDSSFDTCTLDEIKHCGLITLHANLHDIKPFATRHLIDDTFLKALAPETILINASRGDIVDEHALLSTSLSYCTDVYAQEPRINPAVVDFAKLCTPHIAGHSIEAKKNAVIELAKKIYDHFQHPFHHETYPPIRLTLNENDDLENHWLAHYDPSKETSVLKSAKDKTEAFLSLRRAHCSRHDVRLEKKGRP